MFFVQKHIYRRNAEILTPLHESRKHVMKITSLTAPSPLSFLQPDRDAAASPAPATRDMVSLSATRLLQDDEVDGVLDQALKAITGDHAGALSVHSGLNQGRVFALLGI